MAHKTNLTATVACYIEAIEMAKRQGLTWQHLTDAGVEAGLWPGMGSTELATRVSRVRKAIDEGKRDLPTQLPLPFNV